RIISDLYMICKILKHHRRLNRIRTPGVEVTSKPLAFVFGTPAVQAQHTPLAFQILFGNVSGIDDHLAVFAVYRDVDGRVGYVEQPQVLKGNPFTGTRL